MCDAPTVLDSNLAGSAWEAAALDPRAHISSVRASLYALCPTPPPLARATVIFSAVMERKFPLGGHLGKVALPGSVIAGE